MNQLPLLFVIGDSISIQYGPCLEKYVAGQYAYDRKRGDEALVDLNDPHGVNGGDSNRVLAYLDWLKRSGNFAPDVLLINCGLHDIKRDPGTGEIQVDPGQYEANLRAIVGLAGEMAGAVIWVKTTAVVDAIHNRPGMGFHRYNADAQSHGEVERRVMTELNVPLADLESFTNNLGEPQDIFCDHVHFVERVREAQAGFLAGYAAAIISLPASPSYPKA